MRDQLFTATTISLLLSFAGGSLNSRADSATSRPKDVKQLEAEEQKRFAEYVKVCDTGIANYSTSDDVQKAYATLSLAGIHEVVIRPYGETHGDKPAKSYELFVRHAQAVNAKQALNTKQVAEVKRFQINEIPRYLSLMHRLEKEKIATAVRPLQHGVMVIYVTRSDAKIAKRLLAETP